MAKYYIATKGLDIPSKQYLGGADIPNLDVVILAEVGKKVRKIIRLRQCRRR